MSNGIKKTKDYDKFSFIKGNRAIKKNHLSKLRRSIRKKNLLQYNPIIVNENLEVIDGQHRLESAKALDEPIHYIVAKGLGFEDVVMMNTNVKDWGITDYLDSYCDLGYEEYIKTKKFAKRWGLSISNAIAILSMKGVVTRAGYKQFKEGNFEIHDLEHSKEFAKRLRDVAPYATRNTWKDRDFIRALSKAYEEGVEHDRLVEQIQLHPQPLHRRANVTEYLRQFEDVYNRNLANPIRLY